MGSLTLLALDAFPMGYAVGAEALDLRRPLVDMGMLNVAKSGLNIEQK